MTGASSILSRLTRREIRLTQVLLAAALAGLALPLTDIAHALALAVARGAWLDALADAISLLVLSCVGYGVLVHEVARLAWLRSSQRPAMRTAVHAGWGHPVESGEASDSARAGNGKNACGRPSASGCAGDDRHRSAGAQSVASSVPSLTILVPSYKEETRIVRRTLLSAALQTHLSRRVVLLIDDPPHPQDVEGRRLLLSARNLVQELDAQLRCMHARCRDAGSALLSCGETAESRIRLAELLESCAQWLRERAADCDVRDHEESFFADHCLLARATALEEEAASWRSGSGDIAEMARVHAEVASMFDCGVDAFERKRFENVAHEPNKAMNLNSYLALMGGCYREVASGARLLLERCDAAHATLRVPETELVLFLDADTIALPQYAQRMVEAMRRRGHESVAVVQTPYSAFPSASGFVERIAGATTDVQYIVHQGMTVAGAGFWVGANAVARLAALREVAVTGCERGWPVTKYLHDRTVIEDTETTLELRRRGWHVRSLDERLVFSSTPTDFGSLLVQRLRWANGGVLLVPRLVRSLLGGGGSLRSRAAEAAVRLHYLVSLGPASLALLALPFCFYDEAVRAPWLPLMTLSYFGLYGRDLVRCGYRWSDVARVYALNLLLIPVNVAGLLLSLRQLLTGDKPRFVRTPKVAERTPVPGTCIVAQVAMLCFWAAFAIHIAMEGAVLRSSLVALHVGLLAYGITRYIGWNEALCDFLADVRANVPEVSRAAVEEWGVPGER
ncbi:MAG TPA: glycosyltransferase family 2 protein [Candidatus Limnocylindrales bacterium]|nr:glycosyltransferase family 2 protein [Candidatus Limnocylindrales bacterium]